MLLVSHSSAQIQSEQNFVITSELVDKFYSALSSDEESHDELVNYLTKFTDFRYTISQISDSVNATLTNANSLSNSKKKLEIESNIWELLILLTRFESEKDQAGKIHGQIHSSTTFNHNATANETRNLNNQTVDLDASFTSPNLALDNLTKNDLEYTKAKVILNWLETQFQEQNRLKQFHNPGAFANISHYRENTLDQLIRNKIDPNSSRISKELTKNGMNPDFPYINKSYWHSNIDKSDDSKLSQTLWCLLKAGQMDEIKNLLIKSGQHWRWITFFKEPQSILNETIKAFAWESGITSVGSGMNEFDNAIYAINISGDISKVLKVCHTWQEKLWAYLKIFIDVKEQTQIKERVSQFDIYGFDVEDGDDDITVQDREIDLNIPGQVHKQLPNDYWKQEFSQFSEVVAAAVNLAESDSYGRLVRSILTNDTDLLVDSLTEINSPRFAAHIGILNGKVFETFIPIYCRELLDLVKKESCKSKELMSEFISAKLPIIYDILPFYLSKIVDKDIMLEYFGELISYAGNDVKLRDSIIESGLSFGIRGVLEETC